MQDWALHVEKGNFFLCNRYFTPEQTSKMNYHSYREGNTFSSSPDAYSEEKTESAVGDYSKRVTDAVSATFLHYFSRYLLVWSIILRRRDVSVNTDSMRYVLLNCRFQGHSESQKLESEMRQSVLLRVTAGLRASSEGQLVWLQGEAQPNPYTEQQQGGALFNNLKDMSSNDVKGTALPQYFVRADECVQFLSDAFEELDKCRNFLQWSYVLALFEFEEAFRIQRKSTAGLSPTSTDMGRAGSKFVNSEEMRQAFETLQCSLETKTEVLSGQLARLRTRGTKHQIILSTRAAKVNRVQMEGAILNMYRSRDAVERERTGNLRPIDVPLPAGGGSPPAPWVDKKKVVIAPNLAVEHVDSSDRPSSVRESNLCAAHFFLLTLHE
jgi:hypothetical protein